MPEPVQPNLPSLPALPSADASLFLEPKQHGLASAKRLKVENPARYAMVLTMRGEGMGQLRIAQELSMGIHTVRAVLEMEGRALFATEIDNPRAIALMREGRELALERTIEALQDDRRAGKMTPDRLAVTVGILTQNAELLSGNATARVEHVHDAPPAADEFANYLRQGAIDVESRETGIRVGNGGTKALPTAGADRDGEEPGAVPVPVDVAPTVPAGAPGDAVHKMNDQVLHGEKANDSAVSERGDVNLDVHAGGNVGAGGGVDAGAHGGPSEAGSVVPGEGGGAFPAPPQT